jgi:hypothetical protein
LENLLGSSCIKRRIRRRAIRDYQIGEYQNSPHSFNVAPTSPYLNMLIGVHDYQRKDWNMVHRSSPVSHSLTQATLSPKTEPHWIKYLLALLQPTSLNGHNL